MSTRRFCDLCDQPARDFYPTMVIPVGEPYSANKMRSGDISCVQGTFQRSVSVTCEFRDRDKPKGSDGPPDLCTACTKMLLTKLVESL